MKSLTAVAPLAGLACTFGAKDKKASGEHSMTGCLQKGAAPNSYMLDNVGGDGPRSVGVVFSTANLELHVGNKIEITSVNIPAAEADADKMCPEGPHYMKLSAIKNDLDNLPLADNRLDHASEVASWGCGFIRGNATLDVIDVPTCSPSLMLKKAACPKCRSTDFRRSLSPVSGDAIYKFFGRWPFHCRSCRIRFYLTIKPSRRKRSR